MSKRAIEHEVLMKSKRRCCFCVGLESDYSVKPGQVAHLDQDRTNNVFENLAWMCLPHHDQYDSKTSQSRGLTLREAKDYRDSIYHKFAREAAEDTDFSGQIPYVPAANMNYETREHQKRLAYGMMRSSIRSDRKTGILMLIEAHFQRQPKELAPKFETYVAHWLQANRDIDKKLLKELELEYGIPDHPRIKNGYSDWGSYGDSCYRA